MSKLDFDSSGKLVGIETVNIEKDKPYSYKFNKRNLNLKKSDSLEFLKEDEKKFESVFERKYWSLHENGDELEPLKFSNNKTQEDVVKEISELIKNGKKIIFLHGTCGTGKSAIALNVARALGKASIVVPVKALQKQYEEDYSNNMYLIKDNGKKMKIAMITGRDNHDSLFQPGISCADPSLPENIKITERNYKQLVEYYEANDLIRSKMSPQLRDLKRISVAPANPYWSPILPADMELSVLKDAKKIKYLSASGKEYIIYHRKAGCSYYDQHLAYTTADVIIFNAAKYKAEISMGRKPKTEVDIIDEADEFLDGLSQQEELNLTLLGIALKTIQSDNEVVLNQILKINKLIELEEKNKIVLGIDEKKVFQIKETKIKEILSLISESKELESEIIVDELNYANKALEISKNFSSMIDEIYLTYRKEDDYLKTKLVSSNLSAKFKELASNSEALVFMSGTLHSEEVLKNIFGIEDFAIVEAEILNQGSIEIIRTGKEFDCKYSNFASERYTRDDYLQALNSCLDKSILPTLIHVNAFKDLPSEEEKTKSHIYNLMSNEKIKKLQREDSFGRAISLFKGGLSDTLFSTKCSRGVDFPGGVCKSIIFTKYPNPNTADTFWKVLKETQPKFFWSFYKDKAYREFLQRIYRAVRSRGDHVYVLSPDIRVIDAVKELQLKNGN